MNGQNDIFSGGENHPQNVLGRLVDEFVPLEENLDVENGLGTGVLHTEIQLEERTEPTNRRVERQRCRCRRVPRASHCHRRMAVTENLHICPRCMKAQFTQVPLKCGVHIDRLLPLALCLLYIQLRLLRNLQRNVLLRQRR